MNSSTAFEAACVTLVKNLADIGITSASDYANVSEARSYFVKAEQLLALELSFLESAYNYYQKVSERNIQERGLRIVTESQGPLLSDPEIKRLAVYSRRAYLKTDKIELTDYDVDHHTGALLKCTANIYPIIAVAFDYAQEVRRNIILPLPESVTIVDKAILMDEVAKPIDSDQLDKDIAMTNYEYLDTMYSIPPSEFKWLNSFTSVRHDTHLDNAMDAATRRFSMPPEWFSLQRGSEGVATNHDVAKFGWVLPALENIPKHKVFEIRKDYEAEFLRFQSALQSMAATIGESNDERRFREVVSRIESEVVRLNNAVKKIKRTHPSLGLGFTAISLVVYLVLKNPNAINFYHAAFSGLATSAFYSYFRDKRDVNRDFETDPFYFPLLIAKEGEKWA